MVVGYRTFAGEFCIVNNKHPDLFTTDTLKFGFFEPPGQKNLGPVYYQEV